MSRRKATTHENVQYSLINSDNTDGFTDNQFRGPPNIKRVPWKAVGLATGLFILGLTMLVAGCLIFSGHIDTTYGDRMWPLIILGALMFIPGAYHVRLAYYAYLEIPGYSFQDIPEFE